MEDGEVAPALACEPLELDFEAAPDDLESLVCVFASEADDSFEDFESFEPCESDSEDLDDSEPLADSDEDSCSLRLPEDDEPWSFL